MIRVDREKEKTEVKDRQVLDILTQKDERISALETAAANHSRELSDARDA